MPHAVERTLTLRQNRRTTKRARVVLNRPAAFLGHLLRAAINKNVRKIVGVAHGTLEIPSGTKQ